MVRRMLPVPARVTRVLDAALDRGLTVQRPAVLAYLQRIRARYPSAPPAEVIVRLERHYLAAVTGIGAAAGGAAAAPGAGTAAAIATSGAEIAAFVSASTMYVSALAEVHGVGVADPHLRRALVLTVLLGEGGPIAPEAGADPRARRVALGRSRTRERAAGMNAQVTNALLARFGARQGVLVIGRALPLGIGAGIGAAGNAALARATIGAARARFGPPPATFPPTVIDAGVAPEPDEPPRRPELGP